MAYTTPMFGDLEDGLWSFYAHRKIREHQNLHQGSHDLPVLATAHPTRHVGVPVAERRVNVTGSGPGAGVVHQLPHNFYGVKVYPMITPRTFRGSSHCEGPYLHNLASSHSYSQGPLATPAANAWAWTSLEKASHLCPSRLCWTKHRLKIVVIPGSIPALSQSICCFQNPID